MRTQANICGNTIVILWLMILIGWNNFFEDTETSNVQCITSLSIPFQSSPSRKLGTGNNIAIKMLHLSREAKSVGIASLFYVVNTCGDNHYNWQRIIEKESNSSDFQMPLLVLNKATSFCEGDKTPFNSVCEGEEAKNNAAILLEQFDKSNPNAVAAKSNANPQPISVCEGEASAATMASKAMTATTAATAVSMETKTVATTVASKAIATAIATAIAAIIIIIAMATLYEHKHKWPWIFHINGHGLYLRLVQDGYCIARYISSIFLGCCACSHIMGASSLFSLGSSARSFVFVPRNNHRSFESCASIQALHKNFTQTGHHIEHRRLSVNLKSQHEHRKFREYFRKFRHYLSVSFPRECANTRASRNSIFRFLNSNLH